MPYNQSLKGSYNDRLNWFFISLSQSIGTLIFYRKAQPLAQAIENFRGFVTLNHPDKLEQTEELLSSIEAMIESLETLLDG